MFFCPNCNNLFDITRSVATTPVTTTETVTENKQEGGANENVPHIDDVEEIRTAQEIIHHGGALKLPDIINKIIKKEDIGAADVIDIDMDELKNSDGYKKLSTHDKENVFNTIQHLLPADKKIVTLTDNEENEHMAYFICNNCGYHMKIDSGTLIFSKTSEAITETYVSSGSSDIINSKILPHTRNYICSNKTCLTHKEPAKKDAVFYRLNNSYIIRYVCTICKQIF